jgi:hypothetical protein
MNPIEFIKNTIIQFFWKSGYILGKTMSMIGADTYKDGVTAGFSSGMTQNPADVTSMMETVMSDINTELEETVRTLQDMVDPTNENGVPLMSSLDKMQIFSAMMADTDDDGHTGWQSQDFQAAMFFFFKEMSDGTCTLQGWMDTDMTASNNDLQLSPYISVEMDDMSFLIDTNTGFIVSKEGWN